MTVQYQLQTGHNIPWKPWFPLNKKWMCSTNFPLSLHLFPTVLLTRLRGWASLIRSDQLHSRLLRSSSPVQRLLHRFSIALLASCIHLQHATLMCPSLLSSALRPAHITGAFFKLGNNQCQPLTVTGQHCRKDSLSPPLCFCLLVSRKYSCDFTNSVFISSEKNNNY